ncbi:hypothetical protein KO361_00515 [Candidatus Woesearchaeota archaeon]|nr:hypothetical protein [Candidatus Woesearchaeota archaeon]
MKKISLVFALLLLLPMVVSAQNAPIIRLSISNYDPMPVQPGEFVDVWISIQNIGAGEAKDLRLEYLDSPFFELVNPDEKVREISVLGSYRDYTLKYRFKVANNVVEGVNELRFEYSLGGAPGVISTSNLRLDVKSTDVPISISSVRLYPDPVEPGQKAELVIGVTNPAQSSNLRDVSVALQLADTQGGSMFNLPFAPIGSTNKKSINRILPGQTTEFRFSLTAYPDADSKIYKVPVVFAYYDDLGRRYDDISFVSINVNSQPDLYVMIEGITVDTDSRSGEVIFDVVNQGVSDVKLLSVILEDSDSFKVTSASNIEYLGSVESDDFKSARFRILVDGDVDEVAFPLTLTFRDALNNEFVETFEIIHVLRHPESNGNSSGTLIVVLVILGMVVYWYHRRKQRKKKLLDEDD